MLSTSYGPISKNRGRLPVNEKTEEMLLDVMLADLRFVADQMHARMRRIDGLIAQGMILFTSTFGALSIYAPKLIEEKYFFPVLLIAIPFYVLAILQIREDIIRLAQEEYFYRLRERIIATLKGDGRNQLLRLVQATSEVKRGGRFTFFSGVRYAFPVFGCVGSIAGHYVLRAWHPAPAHEIEHLLFWLNLVVFITIFAGGFYYTRGQLGKMRRAQEGVASGATTQ